jgi:BlaI family transcriptional regulator, penicillinase repressor
MDHAELSRRERQIMDVVYVQGTVSVNDVWKGLPDPPSRTAVRTLMRILEEKGHLKHKSRGREFVYQPTAPRGRAGQSAFRRVLTTFFAGSLEKAVAAHLADPTQSPNADELNRLAHLIEQARNKGEPL